MTAVKKMRICIVGAGAIGGWFAAHCGHKLADEVQLSALARGATLAALREHGLRMDSGGERIVVPITASEPITRKPSPAPSGGARSE